MSEWKDIGEQLRATRESKKLELKDVSAATCISADTLRALENSDYSVFANPTYARSFLSQYSAYLGVDADDWVSSLETGDVVASSSGEQRFTRPANTNLLRDSPDGAVNRTGIAQTITVIIITLLIIVGGYYIYQKIEDKLGDDPVEKESTGLQSSQSKRIIMKTIAIDSQSHQALRHSGNDRISYPNASRAGQWQDVRLTGLHEDLEKRKYNLILTDISNATLADVSALIISGRSNKLLFTEDELNAIDTFNKAGGGIFLMGNHKGFVEPQNQIVRKLNIPITFHETWINTLQPRVLTDSNHPIIQGCNNGLNLRTSCTMTLDSNSGIQLVIDENPAIGVIMAAIESPESTKGRIVVSTSAGHIASRDDSGADIYSSINNARITLNTIEWLAL